MTQLLAPWSTISVALDILLVAVVIYQVLVMIRGTRAAPMLAGVAVVAIIFYLARVGELTTLNWLISRLAPYVLLPSLSFSNQRFDTFWPMWDDACGLGEGRRARATPTMTLFWR